MCLTPQSKCPVKLAYGVWLQLIQRSRDWSDGVLDCRMVQVVQSLRSVQPLRSVQALTSFLPRDAGEDEGGGLNGLNDLNGLNNC
jgi:hypothetical protein